MLIVRFFALLVYRGLCRVRDVLRTIDPKDLD